MENKDPFARIMGSFDFGGKKYYKVYFLVDQQVLDKLLFLTDIFGDVDKAIEGSVDCAYKQFAGLLPSEEKALEESRITEKELSELKNMIKRLESRIKEIVSDIISSTPMSTEIVRAPIQRRRSSNIQDMEIPDLVEAEDSGEGASEEPALSLEDAIAQAIVVAIDEELTNVLSREESKEKTGNSGSEEKKDGQG